MLPPLYKFRPINNDTLDSLRNGYLYFSNPTTFNDPFELRAYLNIFDNASTLREIMMDRLKEFRPDLSYVERRKFAPLYSSDPKVREALLSFRHFPDDYLKTVVIYSASARRDCLLLWAHYASNHRGICISLDANRDKRMRQARPVEYCDAYPVVDYFDPDDDAKYRKVILRKSPDWSYEEEYRAVFHQKSGEAKVTVLPSTFVSITFGARITDEDRAAVIDATRAKLSHVRFEQARLAERTYSLEFERCKGKYG